MLSRVVPCISLTIALSSPIRQLSSDDLPALVAPIIAVGIPSLSTDPYLYDWSSRVISLRRFVASSCIFSVRQIRHLLRKSPTPALVARQAV